MKPVHMLIGLFAILPGTAFAQDSEKRAFDGVQVGVSVDRRTLDGDYKVPNFDTKLDEDKAGIGYRGRLAPRGFVRDRCRGRLGSWRALAGHEGRCCRLHPEAGMELRRIRARRCAANLQYHALWS